jgi:hypothetical protein
VKYYTELILEALRKNGGRANLEAIYSYVFRNRKMLDKFDFKRSVRGRIRELKRRGFIRKVAESTYEIVKQRN